ncbi:pantoate--beta-alanine ligase [Dendrosporobacter sp. 1207_IL3150]|uniref:pantoate--beta-alanine ligase n=1 Tax=Dendrosporobacter sp. 1207_IL3150 TaxID=3084054 RepID=UPI002FD9A2CF
MRIVNKVDQLKDVIRQLKLAGNTVGFVPTMGYLHEGHLSLMRQAKQEQDIVVVSIFVNPLQFGPTEDFAVYPRDLARDSAMAESVGVDIVFAPEIEEMYPNGHSNLLTVVDVSELTEGLCGASRPGHFRGVTTVVNKLFNIVEPDVAYFGQKDAQQVAVIKQMVNDLNINVKVVAVPIVRESDGLALSSRNVFLSKDERQAALILSKSLKLASTLLAEGERNADIIRSAMTKLISDEPLAKIDYIAINDAVTLADVINIEKPVLIALAVKIGKTRLIDNMVWEG